MEGLLAAGSDEKETLMNGNDETTETTEVDEIDDTEGHGRFQPTSPAGEPTAPKGQRGTSGNG